MGQAGLRFVYVARAFKTAWEFSGCPAQSLEITTRSGFSRERGLDSSAATTGAIIRAVLDACRHRVSADDLFALTRLAEQAAHGRPSGLDVVVTVSPHSIRSQGGRIRPLGQRIEQAHPVTADPGVHDSTRQTVGDLRLHYGENTGTVGPLIDELGTFAQTAVTTLGDDDASALRTTVDRAHMVLAELDLSLSVLDELTAFVRWAGALSVRLTSGGLGGYMIALADNARAVDHIRFALERSGASAMWIHRILVSEVRE